VQNKKRRRTSSNPELIESVKGKYLKKDLEILGRKKDCDKRGSPAKSFKKNRNSFQGKMAGTAIASFPSRKREDPIKKRKDPGRNNWAIKKELFIEKENECPPEKGKQGKMQPLANPGFLITPLREKKKREKIRIEKKGGGNPQGRNAAP